MKVTLKEQNGTSADEYPFIGISNTGSNLVVLFSDEKRGMVLHSGHSPYWKKGDYHDEWAMDTFDRYNGQVILENN